MGITLSNLMSLFNDSYVNCQIYNKHYERIYKTFRFDDKVDIAINYLQQHDYAFMYVSFIGYDAFNNILYIHLSSKRDLIKAAKYITFKDFRRLCDFLDLRVFIYQTPITKSFDLKPSRCLHFEPQEPLRSFSDFIVLSLTAHNIEPQKMCLVVDLLGPVSSEVGL